jgi:tetratricopeptide (TPR) repeat protein
MNSQLNNIKIALQKQNFHHAENLCWRLYKDNPKDYELLKLLALSLLLQNKTYGAIEKYQQLYEINQKDLDVSNNLALLYLTIEEFKKADDLIQLSINNYPESYYPHLNQGELFFRKRDFHNAKNSMGKVIELVGDIQKYANILHFVQLYGDILLALNHDDEALKFVKSCFDINQDPTIFYYLMNLDKNFYSREKIDEYVESKLSIKFTSASQRFKILAPMYFGLGRYSEKSNPPLSEGCYIKANELSSLVQRFRPLDHQKHIKNIKNLYSAYLTNKKMRDDLDGEGLIFIVGMPRSGTTLVESIIGIDNNVFSGGEMLSIPEILKKYYEGNDINNSPPALDEIAETYLNRVNYLKGNHHYFIDKLPGNFYHVGLILLALPKAKIIHIQRDPWDVAISLFKQLYISNIPYASKFFNIACTIANYEHLMSYWRDKVSENSMLSLKYEDLVKNESFEAKKIMNFLGIKGSYDSNSRKSFFSRTASKIQIKGDVHQKSLKKKDFIDYQPGFLEDLEAQRKYWNIQ